MADQKEGEAAIAAYETSLAAWMTMSSLLVTAGLVQYHIMKDNSLPMPRGVAKALTIGMIGLGVWMTGTSLLPYDIRVFSQGDRCQKAYAVAFTSGSLIWFAIQCALIFIVARDS